MAGIAEETQIPKDAFNRIQEAVKLAGMDSESVCSDRFSVVQGIDLGGITSDISVHSSHSDVPGQEAVNIVVCTHGNNGTDLCASVVLGLYLGVWVMFIGGIVQIITSVTPVVVPLGIAVGIVRFLGASFVGWLSFVVLWGLGVAILES